MACWKEEQFRICQETFPLKTILLVVEFAENYTLQPQNEIQRLIISLRVGEHNSSYHVSTWAK